MQWFKSFWEKNRPATFNYNPLERRAKGRGRFASASSMTGHRI
jgi:hypothetical protein